MCANNGDDDGGCGPVFISDHERASAVFRVGRQAPTEAEHGEGGAPPEVADAVFGFADGAGVVADAEFAEAETGGDGDGGEEGLEELEGEEGGDDFAAHGAELAAAVVEVVAEDAAADEVGEAGHAAAEPGIVAVVAPAARDVEGAGFDGGDEEREIARVVLAVAVHGEENGAAGGAEAVEEGGGLAEVARLVEGAAAGPAGDAGGDLGGGGIGATVVDEDDLVVAAETIEDFDGGADEREDVAGFVEKRDDERVVGRRRHGAAGCGVKTTRRTPGRRPR